MNQNQSSMGYEIPVALEYWDTQQKHTAQKHGAGNQSAQEILLRSFFSTVRKEDQAPMGACGSRPKVKEENQTGSGAMSKTNRDGDHRHRRRRRRILGKRVSSRKINGDHSLGKRAAMESRSQDVAWFDSSSALDSELDEEFHSVQDDMFSLNGSEILSRLSVSDSVVQPYYHQKAKEHFQSKNVSSSHGVRVEVTPEEHSTMGGARMVETVTDMNCGILSNTCIPCLQSSTLPVDKKTSSTPDPLSSAKRKSVSKLSFKWKEGHSLSHLTSYSPKALKQRPVAGSSVPCCPLEKQMPDCWSPIDPSTFKVRGKTYLRDKKKVLAPNAAAFYPICVDVFLSPRKIDHISRFIQLPTTDLSGELPSILVVNIQIPLYPTTIFQSENDGAGMNVVLYFKLSEKFSIDLPMQFRENINKLLNDEVERVKSFPLDAIVPFRDRLKILGRVANVEDLCLSATEKKLMNAYNEKPILSRPQHECYLGENYLEIDLDVHRFSYIARKGFESFHERLKYCTLDFGLTIQGNKAEDLPEHLLCAVRLNKIDHSKYSSLLI